MHQGQRRVGRAGGAGFAGAFGRPGALIVGDFDLVAAQTLSIFVRGTGFGGFNGADGGDGADGWSGQNGQYAGGGGGRGLDGASGSAGRPGAAAFDPSFNSGLNPFTGINSLTTGFVTIEQLTQVAVVPEPATWAMMIAGFGLAGTALRRRRAVGDAGGRAATRP